MEKGKIGDYLTDSLTERAIQFIEGIKTSPSFLNFWYYTVHTPIQAKKEKIQKYTDKAKRLGLTQRFSQGTQSGRVCLENNRVLQLMQQW